MRSGVRVGIDVGRARIGVSRSDLHGMLATPVETVPRSTSGDGDVSRLLSIIAEVGAFEIIVGLPLSLSGEHTKSTEDAERFATRLAVASGLPVRMVDERLSTRSAQAVLQSNGRSTRKHRPVIDQVAAVIILQHALDSERSSGVPSGAEIEPSEGH